MEFTDVQVGVLSSLVAEVLKFIPWLRVNEITVAATAIVVNCIGAYFFTVGDSYSFAQVFISSLVTYKALIQPTMTHLGSKSQA